MQRAPFRTPLEPAARGVAGFVSRAGLDTGLRFPQPFGLTPNLDFVRQLTEPTSRSAMRAIDAYPRFLQRRRDPLSLTQ